jgi:hypothetical protein
LKPVVGDAPGLQDVTETSPAVAIPFWNVTVMPSSTAVPPRRSTSHGPGQAGADCAEQPGIGVGPGQIGPPPHCPAISQMFAAGAHCVPEARKPLGGQSGEPPVQVSATSQMPAAARQIAAAGRGVHVPSADPPAASEQAWQSPGSPPPHALAQHTPSTQKPDSQSPSAAQARPRAEPVTRDGTGFVARLLPQHTTPPAVREAQVKYCPIVIAATPSRPGTSVGDATHGMLLWPA